MPKGHCKWVEMEYGSCDFDTDCGYEIYDYDPEDEWFLYCPYCGREIDFKFKKE